jgi:hypothetical protein
MIRKRISVLSIHIAITPARRVIEAICAIILVARPALGLAQTRP